VLPAVALVLYSLALAAGSLTPVERDSVLAGGAARRALNNLLHVPADAVLTCLWIVLVRQLAPAASLRRACLFGAVAAAAYGAAMEFGQVFVKGRWCSLGDFLLNALGAVLAGLVLWAWGRRAAMGAQGPAT
jgi:VanZ family protein